MFTKQPLEIGLRKFKKFSRKSSKMLNLPKKFLLNQQVVKGAFLFSTLRSIGYQICTMKLWIELITKRVIF